jgi:glucose uptake protein GlcU
MVHQQRSQEEVVHLYQQHQLIQQIILGVVHLYIIIVRIQLEEEEEEEDQMEEI